ncbi:hypothetical protein [Klebsiella phage 05F01]|nr:hypothetical protein [Klebsiella phage 05F01]
MCKINYTFCVSSRLYAYILTQLMGMSTTKSY